MGSDPRKRQRILAKKKARRAAREGRRRAGRQSAWSFDGVSKSAVRHAPIHACYTNANLFDNGIGHVIVSRKLETGEMALGTFLVDVFCLGVKDAFFTVASESDFEQTLGRFGAGPMELKTIPAEQARKLVDAAVDYARALGLEPHPDYHKTAALIFGDIDSSACSTRFIFGKDGKPLYVSGPFETEFRRTFILNTLTAKCGPDGFHYIVGVGDAPETDDWTDADEVADDEDESPPSQGKDGG